jgi:hypothetical protein
VDAATPVPDAAARAGDAELLPTDPQEIGRVEEVVRTLAKTVRAHQLYEGRSPSYDRFVATLSETLALLWDALPALVLDIEENRIVWEAHEVYRSEQHSESLAFLFFRDGIRQLVLLPGFEGTEVGELLRILAQVHRVREEQDDLITLLWEADFEYLRYRNVELATEGLEFPGRSERKVPAVEPGQLREELNGRESPGWRTGGGAAEAVIDRPLVFQEALHVLEPSELTSIAADLREEQGRDLWADVVNGLVDRLEDGSPERQRRVIGILTEFLPGLIGGGQIRAAAMVLRELKQFASREDAGEDSGRAETEALFARLADAHSISELIRSVEDAPEAFPIGDFAELLEHFPSTALANLIGGAETVVRADVRTAIESAVQRLAAREPGRVVGLLRSSDVPVVAGAVRLVGRLAITSAAAEVAKLLGRPETRIRLAAIHAVQELRAGVAAGALQRLLDDREREVRIAAARALSTLRYPPSRVPLENLLGSRRMRDADVTERIAVFEAFAAVAGPQGVPVLDRLLNGRGWLGRKEMPGVRAAAALALGRIAHPSAAEALNRAANDAEPVVRTAVTRSLRPGAS